MSGAGKDKKSDSKQKTATPSKVSGSSDERKKFENTLDLPVMKILEGYKDDEIMTLYEKVKHVHDIVHTKSLLLKREHRLTESQRALIAEATQSLAKEQPASVVDGNDDEEEEDADDVGGMSSDESDLEQGNEFVVAHIRELAKRIVLNELAERESPLDADGYDGMDMDFDDFDEDMEVDDAPKHKKKGPTIEELSSDEEKTSKSKSKKHKHAEEEEEEEEEGEGEEDEEDNFQTSRSVFAAFSILDKDGNVAVNNLCLESNEIFNQSGTLFQGEHTLSWEDNAVFAVNCDDGSVVDPLDYDMDLEDEEGKEDEEDEEDEDDFLGQSSIPNMWEPDVATALREAAGFGDLNDIQFIVLLLRIMTRIIKNGSRHHGPALADGLLPHIVVELSKAAEGEDEEESEEEEQPQKKPEAKKVTNPAGKEHSKPKQDASNQHGDVNKHKHEHKGEQKKNHGEHDKKAHGDHKQHQGEHKKHHGDHKQHHGEHKKHGGDQHKSHGGHGDKPHHGGNKHGGDHKQRQGGHKQQQHGGDHKKHGGDHKSHSPQQNPKKRHEPTGGREHGGDAQKKHKK